MTDRLGHQLGNYRLLRLLGRGGVADVYLGEHIYLKSLAALKLLHMSLMGEEHAAFLKEAQTLVNLSHPHIVRVLDFDVEDDLPGRVMDYAPGGTLRERHPVGSGLPIDTIIAYVKQVASALQYAHDRQLTHRDVKPENMLLGSRDDILLSDFGLAGFAPHTHPSYSTHGTAQQLAGTSRYLAPEQLQGNPQPASDQYALGIVVYEWLCGVQPFSGTPIEIAMQHLSMPPPPLREHVPDLSPAVEQVVLQALAKWPKERFNSVQDFALALEQAAQRETTAPPARSSIRPLADSDVLQGTVKPEPIWKVPTLFTSLVGREQDVATIATLLKNPDIRLLTLVGTGGIGKTRLALQVATAMRPDFDDGICFVPLAPVSDPKLVFPAIARELGLQEVGMQPVFEQVKFWLADKHLLLLLDNFEQLPMATPLVEDLLASCPLLKIVVTSRAVLHLQGEHEYPVAPLTLPDLKQLPTSEDLPHYTAVALFVQRAQAVLPTFQLTPSTASAVAEICVQLDGLPLAIELAAARVKLLPPQALLARLSRRFEVLTSKARSLPVRQQTLRNTLKWSYDLLDAQEQRLFRRLAVLVGRWTLEAVEAVCYDTQQGGTSVLDGVASLLDKSLLLQVEEDREEPRFFMLTTVREYGLECLHESGEAEHIQRAHARYFLALAEEAETQYWGAQATAVLERLEREFKDLRAALSWLVESGEIELALRLGAALWWFWYARGHLSEGRQWLERALSRSAGVEDSVRAKALISVGWFAYQQKDFDRAETLLSESLEVYRLLGDKPYIAASLYRLGLVTWAKGNYPAAQALAEEVMALYNEVGEKGGIADSLLLLSLAITEQGEYARARALAEQALALFREIGDQWAIAYTLIGLARVVLLQGDVESAHILAVESFAIAVALDYKGGIASCLEQLAEIVAARGQFAWAALLWGASENLREIIAIPLGSTERTNYERAVAEVRARLGVEACRAAWAKGRSMTPEQALAMQEDATMRGVFAAVSQPAFAFKASLPSINPDDLTAREVEVLRLLAQGYTDAQIAERLVISPRTVNSHLTSVYRKIQVSSRTAATRYALEKKLV